MKRAFLTGLGITDADIIKQIIDFHQGVVQDLKDDISTVNTTLKTAQDNLKTANKTIDDMKSQSASGSNEDDWKEKYDTLKTQYDTDIAAKQKEYDDYKVSVETEKSTSAKKSILHKQLEADGANPKLIGLLEKEFDLSKIEIESDAIKDWDNVSKTVKEQYSDVFADANSSTEKTSATLPHMATTTGKQSSPAVTAYTLEQIKKMTPAQINENWDKGVKQAIEKGK